MKCEAGIALAHIYIFLIDLLDMRFEMDIWYISRLKSHISHLITAYIYPCEDGYTFYH